MQIIKFIKNKSFVNSQLLNGGIQDEHIQIFEKIGFQPFIFIRSNDVNASLDYICTDQNEVANFVSTINPNELENPIINALCKSLELEVSDSAQLIYDWITIDNNYNLKIISGMNVNIKSNSYVGYPIAEIDVAIPKNDSIFEKITSITNFIYLYINSYGNDAYRMAIIEAFSFGLIRSLGNMNMFLKAKEILSDILLSNPYSIYLKSADNALDYALSNKDIPERLRKFIGAENDYLDKFVCPEPFKRFDIGPTGEVLVCCGHWLPKSIGNFENHDSLDILNSTIALKIRKSIVDGSYKYCNHLECTAMIQENLPLKSNIKDPIIISAIKDNNFHLNSIENVLFAYDRSCNLSCPSCRSEVVIEKESDSFIKYNAVEDRLIPLLPFIKVLNLNPAGELFASKASRRLLQLITDDNCPDLIIDIITNGTLLNHKEWNKFPDIHNKVRSIRISTDAASGNTFEKLRRLGNWNVFCDNLNFISELRSKNIISELKLSFTYQDDNFFEMLEFVGFCENLNADYIIFERLQNLGAFTHSEFLNKAVHRIEHHNYNKFINIIKNPIFMQKLVWHDFDYDGVEIISQLDAQIRSKNS